MNLTFQQLVERFLKGDTTGVSSGIGNLKIKNDQLIHYSTVIAERYKDKVLVNISRYSLQTGKLQKILRESISFKKLVEVRRVPKNYTNTLANFIDK